MTQANMTQADNLGLSGDHIYEALMRSHDGLTTAQSHALNARLVLLMANHIGDKDALTALFDKARSYHDAR